MQDPVFPKRFRLTTALLLLTQVESIEDPPSDLDMSHVRLKRDGCSGLVIFVIYDSVRTALAAVAKLHGQPLGKQTQKSAKRQKLGADDAVSEQLWARQVSGEGLHLKQWRVIIRNLAFQVSQQHDRTQCCL